MTFQHPSDRGGDERGSFERFSERASNLTSSPMFFSCCLLLVCVIFGVHLSGLSLSWQLLAGDLMSAVTLLPALLKNTERRAEHAIQRKLDAIAGALLEQQRGKTGKAFASLETAIRMEEET
jgi:low affinity Fe/Cu permease